MLNSINTNVAAYTAHGNIGKASNSAASSIARLSSGNRIVKSSDDVAALSIGTSLRTGVNTLKQALNNTSQASSLLQVADGALAQISEILQRQKSIATQANSGTLTDTERGYLDQEFQALTSQIDQIAANTKFSSVNLLDGSLSGTGGSSTSDVEVTASLTTNASTIHGLAPSGINILDVAYAQAGTGGEETFYGDLSGSTFTVTDLDSSDTDLWQVTFVHNNITYLGNIADATATGGTLVMTNGDGTATLTLTLAADLTADTTAGLAITNAADFQTRLNTIFDNATAYSSRVGQTADLAAATTGILAGGMRGQDLTFVSTTEGSFTLPNPENFRADGFGVGMTFSVDINGETYTTKELLTSDTDLSAAADQFGDGNTVMRFYRNQVGPQLDYFEINLTSVTGAIDVSDEDGVSAFLAALDEVFRPTDTTTGNALELRVGSDATDTISVSIDDASTATIYQDEFGAAITTDLSVTDIDDAADASEVLDRAIGLINAARADIGALQSRLDFTAANLQSSIQNQDAARGTLLDTDVATESTAYATAQVQLQAGIAVLAQANLLPQNLLKLIG